MDFTRRKYRELLVALQRSGLSFQLRHDVDKRPAHSVALAQIEAELGIKAVYYFRCVPCSNDPECIQTIVDLGHEIGYHYEDMSLCHGDAQLAIKHFKHWLTYFRQFYPVHRICMHGAPTSQFDGKDLWKHFDYRDFGVDYEPYFDEDYTQTLYLTDTGRCWDGYKVSVRDKVPQQEEWNAQGLTFHTTDDIIAWLNSLPSPSGRSENPVATVLPRAGGTGSGGAVGERRSPRGSSERPALLLTTHPQRWTDNALEWVQEYISQTLKNIIKRLLIWARKS